MGEPAAESGEALRQQVAEVLEASDTAAQLVDEQGRLVWTSRQLLAITGLPDREGHDEDMRVGADAVEQSRWSEVVWGKSADDVAEHLGDRRDCPIWQISAPMRIAGQQQTLGVLGIALRTDAGPAGSALVFSPQLPAQVVTMLSRGDAAMFRRMADLTKPAPRAAAVVFADIESSARLARRLSTHHYFAVIRAVTTAVDQLVTELGGIVGKHAGDGTSAFFLAEQCDGESGAARAGLSLALALPDAVRDAVLALGEDGVSLDPDDCLINVGAHWSADLYMGQVVTGGRLEISALGDAVNETARIEHVASGGEVLASKGLLERLEADDAKAVGLDPLTRTYDVLGDLIAPEDKANRDAGTIAVTYLVRARALGLEADVPPPAERPVR